MGSQYWLSLPDPQVTCTLRPVLDGMHYRDDKSGVPMLGVIKEF